MSAGQFDPFGQSAVGQAAGTWNSFYERHHQIARVMPEIRAIKEVQSHALASGFGVSVARAIRDRVCERGTAMFQNNLGL